MCYNEIGVLDCVCSKYRHHSKFNSEHNWESLCDRLESMKNFTFDSYKFCTSTPILKLAMIIFTGGDNSWSNPAAKTVYEVGSVHNRATCLISHLHHYSPEAISYALSSWKRSEFYWCLKYTILFLVYHNVKMSFSDNHSMFMPGTWPFYSPA